MKDNVSKIYRAMLNQPKSAEPFRAETKLSADQIEVGLSQMDQAVSAHALVEPVPPPAVPAEGLESTLGPIPRKWLNRALAFLTVFACVYAGAVGWIGLDQWRRAMHAISFQDALLTLCLVFVGFLLRAQRWLYYTSLLGWKISILQRFTAFIASFAFTATPGKAGELVKVFLLRGRNEVSLTEGASILLIERLGDLLAVVLLACGSLILFTDLRVYIVVGIVLVGGMFVAVANRNLSNAILAYLTAIPRLRPVGLRLVRALEAGRQLLRPVPFAVGIGLALVAWTCEATAFHVLISDLGIQSSYLVSLSIYGVSTLAGALAMLPGGLGGFEAVMAFLLIRLATPASVATVAVVIFRLCTLWLFSLIGVVFMFAWMVFLTKRRRPNLVVEAK
jgi:uncharacterized protein (TIRG00374 family)